MFAPHPARGFSLLELLVALLLLEIAGVAALAAILTSHRVHRRMASGGEIDVARWVSYREAELASDCADTTVGRAVPLTFPAEGPRPVFEAILGCGR